jgi:hypothetical protein
MERGHHGKNAPPICYVPEHDLVLGSLSESTVSTNTVKMPGGTKTHVKVWVLDFVMQFGGLIKHLGYWMAIVEPDEVLAAVKQALTDAEAALKATRKEDSKNQIKANASDAEKADALEKRTAVPRLPRPLGKA